MNARVNEAELAALIQLIDDPDEEIYGAVSQRIVGYGKTVLPQLEQEWETCEQPDQQLRIDALIQRIHFDEVTRRFDHWRMEENPSLWSGLLILDQLHHREDRTETLNRSLELVRRNAWLELNQYLTPLEQINVLSRVLFEHNGFKPIEPVRERMEHYFIGDVLLKRAGNQMGLGMLLLVLADELDLPLEALQVPGLFVLGSPNPFATQHASGIETFDFFVDPQTGELFGRVEIEQYLRRTKQPMDVEYFAPHSNVKLVENWLYQIGKKAIENQDTPLNEQIIRLLGRL